MIKWFKLQIQESLILRRIIAYLLDGLLCIAFVMLFASLWRNPETGVMFIFGFLFTPIYFTILDSRYWNWTLWKKAMRIQVVDKHLKKIGLLRSLIRWFIKYIFTLWIIWAYYDKKTRWVHDLIVWTEVISY